MNLTESYVSSNGYDYYGNAAEDTLVFFIRDSQAPFAESSSAVDDIENNIQSSDSIKNEDHENELQVDKNVSTDFDNYKNIVPDANTDDDEWNKPITNVAQKQDKKNGFE